MPRINPTKKFLPPPHTHTSRLCGPVRYPSLPQSFLRIDTNHKYLSIYTFTKEFSSPDFVDAKCRPPEGNRGRYILYPHNNNKGDVCQSHGREGTQTVAARSLLPSESNTQTARAGIPLSRCRQNFRRLKWADKSCAPNWRDVYGEGNLQLGSELWFFS